MTIRLRTVAISMLLGCGPQLPPVADLGPSDLGSADLAPGPCEGWACRTDAECPPSLCAPATGFGACRAGVCEWK